MEIIIILICISLVVAVLFLTLFILNVKNGQYDDMHTPAVRILFDNKNKQEIKLEDGKSEKDGGR